MTVGNSRDINSDDNLNVNNDNNNNNIYNHSMSVITSKFDKDIIAPYRAKKDIEAKIKIIKSQLAQPIYNIKNIKIQNKFKKSDIDSLKKLKNTRKHLSTSRIKRIK